MNPLHPSLYQINTRVWLNSLSVDLGRPATLDDVPDSEVDHIAALGFDWVWLLGVWQTGVAGRSIALTEPDLQREYHAILPDLRPADVAGSCFSISGYTVHASLGGDGALDRLRRRLHERGLRLMLDFVPNHTALDHPWVRAHPEFYVHGTENDLVRTPRNYRLLELPRGPVVLAHGRDPYFPGWTDTLQLNYAEPCLQEAMAGELARVAGMCEAVRCDMAMLILPDVFERTWGLRPRSFWPDAIRRVRAVEAEFLFMAEVYWDLEWTLQQQGFDYTYDKRLYDRLREGAATPVRDHFRADPGYQAKSARFLENHDEPRAAATFPQPMHRAAAVLTYLSPGLRFFHQGQLEGRRVRIPVQLTRAPHEAEDPALRLFYDRLLSAVRQPAVRDGQWQVLDCEPAWEGNPTSEGFISFAWTLRDTSHLLITVNYAPDQGQCYMRLPFPDLAGRTIRLADRLGPSLYNRSGDDLLAQGLYLDLPAWGCHIFEMDC